MKQQIYLRVYTMDQAKSLGLSIAYRKDLAQVKQSFIMLGHDVISTGH